MHRAGRQTRQYRRVVVQIAPGAAEPGGQQHARAPGPAFGDIQPPLRRRNQRDGYQPVVQQQPECWLLLQKMLVYQLPYGRAHALLIAGPVRLEQVGKGRFVTRSEEHTSELQSLMRISYAVLCLKKKKQTL